jgi:hypothetical protein
MNIEHVQTEDLIPYARNAKLHSDSQVCAIAGSIKEFGFNAPVLVDAQNGIIAGHGRVLAARKLGLDKVPCIRLAHLTDTQRRAYILADNRLSEVGGGWDEEMLKIEVSDMFSEGVDLKNIGLENFDFGELQQKEDTQTFTGKGKNPLEKLDAYLEAEAKTLSFVFKSSTFEKVVSFLENKKAMLNAKDFSEVVLNLFGITEDEND